MESVTVPLILMDQPIVPPIDQPVVLFRNPRYSELRSKYSSILSQIHTIPIKDRNTEQCMELQKVHDEISEEMDIIMKENEVCSKNTIEPFEMDKFGMDKFEDPPQVAKLEIAVQKLRARLDVFQFIADELAIGGMGAYGRLYNSNKSQLTKELNTHIDELSQRLLPHETEPTDSTQGSENPSNAHKTDVGQTCVAILGVVRNVVNTFEYVDIVVESFKMLTWSVRIARERLDDAAKDVATARASSAAVDARAAAKTIHRAIELIDFVIYNIHSTREEIKSVPPMTDKWVKI